MTAPPHHFDRSKPFYPVVMGYVCQLVGITELAVRGLVGPRDLDTVLEEIIARDRAAGIPIADPAIVRKQLMQMTESLQLRCEMTGGDIKISIDEFAQELVANHDYLLPAFLNAAGSVFVMAHEISKGQTWHNQDPMWEFLRHCRNAVAHGSRFNFHKGEPKRTAQWGGFVLDSTFHGTPMFKKDGGMLSPGDPVHLLWDIEQAYPSMTVV